MRRRVFTQAVSRHHGGHDTPTAQQRSQRDLKRHRQRLRVRGLVERRLGTTAPVERIDNREANLSRNGFITAGQRLSKDLVLAKQGAPSATKLLTLSGVEERHLACLSLATPNLHGAVRRSSEALSKV